ncbi:MAG: endonuclease/exonuclease/phosphatase family protein, partial [Rhodococcus sp.]|nr:endonuclease/exonuclease/phosphatase family protein [Rhodococcus sp. (in: high G+C Gram-positive bacteria)]
MRIVRIVAAVIGWLAVAIALVGLGARSFDTTRQWVLIVGAAAPYLLAASVVAIAAMALARQKIGLAVALCVAIAGVFTQAPLFFSSDTPSLNGPEITVLQANIWVGNADADAFVRQVRDENVDVVTVNELTPEALDRLTAAGLDEALPFSFVRPDGFAHGTGIWSKYPLSDESEYDNFAMFQLSAKVTLPDGQWSWVYAFHPVPPWPT